MLLLYQWRVVLRIRLWGRVFREVVSLSPGKLDNALHCMVCLSAYTGGHTLPVELTRLCDVSSSLLSAVRSPPAQAENNWCFTSILCTLSVMLILMLMWRWRNYCPFTHRSLSIRRWVLMSSIDNHTQTTPPHHNRFTALFPDHPGEPVPEENFWTLWCKGRLTEADTPTIRLGATPSALTSAHLHHPPTRKDPHYVKRLSRLKGKLDSVL